VFKNFAMRFVLRINLTAHVKINALSHISQVQHVRCELYSNTLALISKLAGPYCFIMRAGSAARRICLVSEFFTGSPRPGVRASIFYTLSGVADA